MKPLGVHHQLGIADATTGFESFMSNIRTFRNWDFFVDWAKAKRNVVQIERDLNLLNSLLGKENFREDFKSLLSDYPELVRCIPILFAYRAHQLDDLGILVDSQSDSFEMKHFHLLEPPASPQVIDDLTEFVIGTGISRLFTDGKVRNLVDYVFGVEVGLDSNARKGRSGAVMEAIVEAKLRSLQHDFDFDFMSQASVSKMRSNWNLDKIANLAVKKFDFAVLFRGNLTLIEVNFYAGAGSKLGSVCSSFIELQRDLRERGLNFVWVTDGLGWKHAAASLERAFGEIDNVLNLRLLELGAFEEALGLSR